MAGAGKSLSGNALRGRVGVIFLTVGSALPFDRLVQMVDEAAPMLSASESVFAQIGRGQYKPRHFEYVDFLSKVEFDRAFERASLVISHAGIGTIKNALYASKPILVMPRQKVFGELVDDHQVLTAHRFEEMGHLLAFSTREEFSAKIANAHNFSPKPRRANAEGISAAIGAFLAKA
jgi:beta-1,4-N-acetylglucosaminyltransferase